jgi:hypothetical protein
METVDNLSGCNIELLQLIHARVSIEEFIYCSEYCVNKVYTIIFVARAYGQLRLNVVSSDAERSWTLVPLFQAGLYLAN